MPNNVEAEASVLGSILIDNIVADTVIPRLKPRDFYLAQNRIIFEAMKELQNENKSIDTVTVSDRLELKGQLDEVGSIAYLSELAESVPSAANCDYYTDIVKRDSLLRRIIQAGNEISKYGYESADAESALVNAEKQVYDISEEQTEKALVHAGQAFADALNEINSAQVGKMSDKIIKTGFNALDRKTRGLKPGALIILAARPSVGKTALALNIAANVALNPVKRKNVAIFSLEMSSPELAKRMLAYISGVSLTKMDLQGGLRDGDIKRVANAYKLLINSGIYIDDYSMNGPADVLSKCRRLKREKGLDLIIIDYLQLMTNTDEKVVSSANRQEEVSKMSRRMKVFARELDCPIIILSQMSRGIEQRNDHKPLLSDLRESGSIEQDADIVSFLYNPSRYNAALPTNQVILDVMKNRSGPTGAIMLEWTGETTTFKEIGEVQDNSVVQSEDGKQKEVSTVEQIRNNVSRDAEMQEVTGDLPFGDTAMPFGDTAIPLGDTALPFGTDLAASDVIDDDLKNVLSAPVKDNGTEGGNGEEYSYDDDDAPPEGDDDLPF